MHVIYLIVDTTGPTLWPLWFSAGQIAFREFLKSEYSEENILFWLACEEYKKIKSAPEMISSANRIYSEFVQTEAPKQVNDSKLKKKTGHSFKEFKLNSICYLL